MEALKNYILDINGRIGVIEDGIKSMDNACGDLIIEKVERVKRELADLDDRIDSVEDKLEEEIESTVAKIVENLLLSHSIEKHTKENKLLLELVNENERKLKQVEARLVEQEELLKKNVPDIKCDENIFL